MRAHSKHTRFDVTISTVRNGCIQRASIEQVRLFIASFSFYTSQLPDTSDNLQFEETILCSVWGLWAHAQDCWSLTEAERGIHLLSYGNKPESDISRKLEEILGVLSVQSNLNMCILSHYIYWTTTCYSPSVMGKESVLIASRAIRSLPSLEPLRLCFSLRRKKDLRAAADRVLVVPLSSFKSAMPCLL